MIKYKIDILESLKNAGYSTYKMRKDKILGESVLQQIRRGEPVSWNNLDTICDLLDCQPGDLLVFVRDSALPDEENIQNKTLAPEGSAYWHSLQKTPDTQQIKVEIIQQPKSEAVPVVVHEVFTEPQTEQVVHYDADTRPNSFRFDDAAAPSIDDKQYCDEFNAKRFSYMERLRNYGK